MVHYKLVKVITDVPGLVDVNIILLQSSRINCHRLKLVIYIKILVFAMLLFKTKKSYLQLYTHKRMAKPSYKTA